MSDEPWGAELHQSLRESLGLYVLGRLPEDEAVEVERHLEECAECRAEYAELAPVAGALADLRGAEPTTAHEPPADLGARIEAAVGHEQRHEVRSRWVRSAGLAGIAAAVVAVVGVAGLRLTEPDQPVVPLEPVTIAREAAPIDASADLVAHTWGVEVKLSGTGFVSGERYAVAVIGPGGQDFTAGEFVGTGAREMHCNLNSSVLRDRAEGFEVRDPSGAVVVASRF